MKPIPGVLSALLFSSTLLGAAPFEAAGGNGMLHKIRPYFPKSDLLTEAGISVGPKVDQPMEKNAPSLFSALPQGVTGASLSPAAAPELMVSFSITRQVTEGKSGQAVLKFNYPPDHKIKFTLKTAPGKEVLKAPSSLSLPAGAKTCKFSFTVVDDKLVNLTRTGTFGIFFEDELVVANQFTIIDNEKPPVMTLKLPAQLIEGKTPSSSEVVLDRPAAVDFAVAFESVPVDQIDAPPIVVRAGRKSAKFKIGAKDDLYIEGNSTVKVNARATGLAPASTKIKLIDNELKEIGLQIPATVLEGPPTEGVVTLSGKLKSDLIVKLQSNGAEYLGIPSSVTIPAGKSSAKFFMDVMDHSVVQISHIVGITASAAGFPTFSKETEVRETLEAGLTSTLSLATKDLVWDATRGRFYASVSSAVGTPHANHVVAIDPDTLSVTASVLLDGPGQLAMTSGGEALHVVTNKGNIIAKIRLSDFTVESSFTLGNEAQYNKPLHALDLFAAPGKPDLVIVSVGNPNNSPTYTGITAYDHGIPLLAKIAWYDGGDKIEPSADPSVFFAFNSLSSDLGLHRIKLGAEGITKLAVADRLFEGYDHADIRTGGNTVFSNLGGVADGAALKPVATLSKGGWVCPDPTLSRVYAFESEIIQNDWKNPRYQNIISYDPVSYLPIRQIKLKKKAILASAFIPWGVSGLAFRTPEAVTILDNRHIRPAEPQTDLAVSVRKESAQAVVGEALIYSINVSNVGSNPAPDTVVSAILSAHQKVTMVSPEGWTATPTGLKGSVSIGDIPPGGMKTVTISVRPETAGPLSITGAATSHAIEQSVSNNSAVLDLIANFKSLPNSSNELRLAANNLVHDASRGLLWASIPATKDSPNTNSIISIDPLTGAVSAPIPLDARPYGGSMVISGNGRYLYLGLWDVAAVHRIDLATPGYPSLRISLGAYPDSLQIVRHIETLDGDGTGIIVVLDNDSVLVFDGAVRRPGSIHHALIDAARIVPGGVPGKFVTHSGEYGSVFTPLTVTDSDITMGQKRENVIPSGADIVGSGGLILSDRGNLVDANTLTLKFNLGVIGVPCLDAGKQRAYMVTSGALLSFDTTTGKSAGSMPLSLADSLSFPWEWHGQATPKCVRWGSDGLAVMGGNGRIYIIRWDDLKPAPLEMSGAGDALAVTRATIDTLVYTIVDQAGTQRAALDRVTRSTQQADSDADGITDDLEHVFGTSPSLPDAYPMTQTIVTENGTRSIHLSFPRRSGVSMPTYGYAIINDRMRWAVLTGVVETVVSTQMVDGVMIENVEASAPVPSDGKFLVRLYWNP